MKCIILLIHLLLQDTISLNRDNLINQLQHDSIQYTNVVYAQALLESNSFKSHSCKKYNNVFGMTYPNKRITVAKKHYPYAKYDNWKESVQDYKLFQCYIFGKRKLTEKQYITYICRKYAKDRSYRYKLKKIMTADEARAKSISDSTKDVNKKITALDIKIQARLSSPSKLTHVNIEIKDSILEEFKNKVIELGYTISNTEESRYNKEIKVLTINW